MNASNVVYAVSVGFHVLIGVGLSYVRVKPPAEIVAVEMQTIEREKPKPKPEPEPESAPKPVAPKSQPKPAAPTEAPPPARDFGFALGPPGEGPGGVAVPAPPTPAPVRQTAAKKLGTAAVAETCTDPDTKPKPRTFGKPAKTEAALAAGVIGKVRVEVTIDAEGRVVAVKVLEGLGYGLDEAAVAAAQAWTFAPATHCGKPVTTTVVVGLNFG